MSRTGFSPGWVLRMAWRDSRRSRSRLLLFLSSITLGIAALVAIYSLGANLNTEIDRQAASLLGADLRVTSNSGYGDSTLKMLDSIKGRKAEEKRLASMVYFPKSGGSRLVQVRAISDGFPFYGDIETEPASADSSFRKADGALVDQTLLIQYKAQPGDSIRLGRKTFIISGSLLSAPGQSGISATIAPIVYIPLSLLDSTGLIQLGSRVGYSFYYKYDNRPLGKTDVDSLESRGEREGYSVETISSQKESTGKSFEDLTRFLGLVGFVALLLGCIGVASSVHIYIREKMSIIAILRCLGASSRQAFFIYLYQILATAFMGAVIGAGIGLAVQQYLPEVLKDFIPFNVASEISWRAVFSGMFQGLVIAVLFAILPLISIRKIAPLRSLRIVSEDKESDPLRILAGLAIFAFIWAFSFMQLQNALRALFFTLGVGFAFLLLYLMARLVMFMVRRFFPVSWNYLWRQSLANLFRPNNQTATLIVSVGLGTALISMLILVQDLLLQRVQLAGSGNQSNTILFDIRGDQKERMVNLKDSLGVRAQSMVPIVTMRLESVNGRKGVEDSTYNRRMFTREYRVTYRDSVVSSEKILKGSWPYKGAEPSLIPISLEEGFVKNNKLKIGDTLNFNVQGAYLTTFVAAIRSVEWNRIQTNFIAVFPDSVLEKAPQSWVMMARVENRQQAALFQEQVLQRFPNVSVIDLNLVLELVDRILDKIGFVIRFMALFSIFTGLCVLIASVMISKYQRMREAVLLRTIGASGKQILWITLLEYFFLGTLASLTGLILSFAGAWALAHFTFQMDFKPHLAAPLLVSGFVIAITILIGWLNSTEVLRKSPLEILREI